MKRIVALAVTGAALLAGCGSPDDAVEVSFADACAEDDRWVTVEGYLGAGVQTRCESIGDSEECHMLLTNPDDESETVTATIEVGDGNNQMEPIPDNYTDADLVFRDNAGTEVGVDDLVKVTGTASNDEAGFTCRLWVRRIEAVE